MSPDLNSQTLRTRPTFGKYLPMEVQYRLFKHVWRQCLQPESNPVNIYTFYDNVDIEFLIGYRFNPEVFDILFSFSNVEPWPRFYPAPITAQDPLSATRPSVGKCWVLMETQPPLPKKILRSHIRVIGEAFDPFVKRLLEEPDSLKKYNMEVVESHVLVVCRCLWIIHKLSLLSDRG